MSNYWVDFVGIEMMLHQTDFSENWGVFLSFKAAQKLLYDDIFAFICRI